MPFSLQIAMFKTGYCLPKGLHAQFEAEGASSKCQRTLSMYIYVSGDQ